jgi:hypothetical protein
VDHRLRWLLDLVLTGAWVWVELVWYRNVQPRPRLRLVTGSAAPARGRRRGRVNGVITILVSRREMEQRVRSALGPRAVVRVTTTWAELEQLIAGTRPLAVFADPLADPPGDPVGHLARLCRDRQMPLILYTTLTPDCAAHLIQLGQLGIRHVVFHRFDDNAERLNQIVDSQGPPHSPPLPPPPPPPPPRSPPPPAPLLVA